MRRSRRVQGLPRDLPPIAGDILIEAVDQGAATDSHVEGNPTVEVGEEFTTYDNPLVKQPPMADTSFNFPMEGHVGSSNWVVDRPSDDTKGTKYVLNAPFWRITLGQVISEFGTIKPSFVNTPRDAPWNEEMYRIFQPSIDHLHSAQESLEKFIASPIPHRTPMSALLPYIS